MKGNVVSVAFSWASIDDDMRHFIEQMPKAELHIHMEGAVLPATLLKLAERHGMPPPAEDLEGMAEFYSFSDFAHFVEVYLRINELIRTPEDCQLITVELAEEAARQNIRYMEVILSPGTLCNLHELSFDEIWEGYLEGTRMALRDYGVRIQYTIDIIRDTRPDLQTEAAHWAAKNAGDPIVGLNLGGTEAKYPPELYETHFDIARAAGLKSTPHAGELMGPPSMWGAINVLKADRLGHGIRAVDDPALVTYLAEHRIPLEISPTSNICTKAVASFAEHPFRQLYDAGVIVTVNSDDPPMFNTTLNQEYATLVQEFGFTRDELKELSLTAVRESFLPAGEKAQMLADFENEFATLAREDHTA